VSSALDDGITCRANGPAIYRARKNLAFWAVDFDAKAMFVSPGETVMCYEENVSFSLLLLENGTTCCVEGRFSEIYWGVVERIV
jgi:hypothetical protein